MPYPIGHACLGVALVAAALPRDTPYRKAVRPMLAASVLSVLPDLDLYLVWVQHMDGMHRAFSHSLTVGAIVAMLIVWLGRAQLRLAIALGLAFLSHGLLDYATSAGSVGVQLFWPFSGERYKLGWFDLHTLFQGPGAYQPLLAILVELGLFVPPLMIYLLWRRRGVGISGQRAPMV